jgi:ADP-ribosylglycohydrolase
MIGAITGDCVGSIYEWNNIKTKNFPFFGRACYFTDDSVLTIALADSILSGRDYDIVMREYYQCYPSAGYGSSFKNWAQDDDAGPYDSYGNGSAMRTSPVGYAYDSLDEVLDRAEYYASFTHNHPEGMWGAQVTAGAIYLARTGASIDDIRTFGERFYDLSRTVDDIRPEYKFDVSCQGTVPEAVICFLESDSFEDAIRNAISLGGDSDTLACITGGIASAFYGVPDDITHKTMSLLDDDLQSVLINFYDKYHTQKLERVAHEPENLFTEVEPLKYLAPKPSLIGRLIARLKGLFA